MEFERVLLMEENPRRRRLKKRAHKAQSSSRTKSPPPLPLSSSSSRDLPEAGECSVDCSGQSCRSCSAALVADCVALCCCPLAFVSLLGLAFIKVPCAMGKRCLGRRKKKKEKRKVCVRENEKGSFGKEETMGVKSVFGEEVEGEIVEQMSLCGEISEGDSMLLEMYQVAHLGFGRVSYTETHPNGIVN